MPAPRHGAKPTAARRAPSHARAAAAPARRTTSALLAAAVAVVLVAGAATAVVLLHGLPRPAAGRGAARTAAAHHGSSGPSARHPTPPPALRVESTSPAGGAANVAYAPTVTVRLSAPLAPGSPLPRLTPSIPGSWSVRPAGMLVFRAEAEYAPYTVVRLTIPGGSGGLRDARGALLTSTVTRSFTVAGGSELRLQQLLAELGYLPLSFTRSTSAGSSSGGAGLDAAAGAGATASGPVTEAATGLPAAPAIAAEPRQADRIDLAPVPGRFSWRWSGVPAALSSLWSAGTANVVTRGAVMAFEAEEGLTVDGDAGPMVWQALLGAVASRHLDPAPYDWISVSEAAPETLTVWQDGQTLFHVEANTGIAQAPTAPGTFPVYARYLVTTMSGTNPDGSKYKDPGIPHVAYFNGGDAIHGFIRAGYGYPQSLGCVELTYADAARVWQYDQLGTLVTVS